jgi:predicted nucleotidyltransferase component of viral defense system
MSEINFQEDMDLRVFLLAIYKKKENETIKDIINMMINAGLFDMKNGKKSLKDLKKLDYIIDEELTMLGITKAKEVELEFKI